MRHMCYVATDQEQLKSSVSGADQERDHTSGPLHGIKVLNYIRFYAYES